MCVYFIIKRTIYGFKQLGALANEMLAKYQEKRDINYQAKAYITKGLWMHKTKKISFILVVDDFVQSNIT